MKYLWVQARSVYFPENYQNRKVLVDDTVFAVNALEKLDFTEFRKFMADYLGWPENYKDEEWKWYNMAAVTITVERWSIVKHGEPDTYKSLEGYKNLT